MSGNNSTNSNNTTPSPPPSSNSPSSSSSTSDKGSLFNKLAIADIIRMSYTYAMFIFTAIILVKFQALEYQHVFIMTFIYILLTLVMEIIWLYFFRKKFRDKPDIQARDTFHNILNNILPFSILIFGYATLLDAFRSGHFATDGEHIEFYVRSITGFVFIIAYVYLFVELFNRFNDSKSKLSGSPTTDWKTDFKDDDRKNATMFDNIIDLMYNLFQPISILVIAGLMYVFIRFTNGMEVGAVVSAPPVA